MRHSVIALICAVALVSVVLSGCTQQADVGLKFQPGDECVYKVVHQSGKSYRFEQPAEDKVKDKNTDRRVEMILSQRVNRVTEDGAAIVDVTVEELKYYFESPKGVQQSFDSTASSGDTGEFAGAVGKGYRIKLNRNGEAEVVSNSEIKKACKGKHASWLFNRESIVERHSIEALPDTGTSAKVGDSWSKVVSSPKGMLQAKTYEKVYTLEEVYEEGGNKLGVVRMTAIPTSQEPEEGQTARQGKMGFFSKMFDSQDTYTGKLVVNLDTGQVREYREHLDARWVATDDSSGGKGGPDVLKMGYTDKFSMKLLER